MTRPARDGFTVWYCLSCGGASCEVLEGEDAVVCLSCGVIIPFILADTMLCQIRYLADDMEKAYLRKKNWPP